MFARSAQRTFHNLARSLNKSRQFHANVCTPISTNKKWLLTASTALLGATAFTALTPSTTFAESAKVKPYTGIPKTCNERTFIAVKPDGVQRGLINEVIARFEKKGFKLVALKMVIPSKQRAREHYADLSSRPFFNGLVEFFSSGPVVCMVWEGTDVILTGRKILGATNPNDAPPGTLRGDNCISTGRNLVHGSDGPDSAAHEIGMWFTADEINDWDRTVDSWVVANN